MKHFLIVLLSFLFLSSCVLEKEVEYPIPFEGEKLVVYGLLTNDHHSSLEASLSAPVDRWGFDTLDFVDGAIVSDNATDAFNFSDGVGYSSADILLGKEYHIIVQYEDKKIVSESVKLPMVVPIDSVSYHLAEDSLDLTARIYFTDNPDEVNYYAFFVQGRTASGAPFRKKGGVRNPIKDEDFQSFYFDFDLDLFRVWYSNDWTTVYKDTIRQVSIKFYNVSHEVYDFYESIEDSELRGITSGDSPNPIWSNIKGGYGYLGAASVDSVVIKW